MRIFTTKHNYNHWHYLNAVNVKKYLSDYPYLRSDGKFFAICPYCHNPIRIIQRKQKKKLSLKIYAQHCHNSVGDIANFNATDLSNCILTKPVKEFALDSFWQSDFKVENINIDNLRKDLTYLTGIYFSTKLTNALVHKHTEALNYRGTNRYNYPFVLLLASNFVSLKYRKIANPRLQEAIKKKSNLYSLTEDGQVFPSDDYSNSSLNLYIGEQSISESNLPILRLSVVESCNNEQKIIYSFHIFAKMFKNVVLSNERKIK